MYILLQVFYCCEHSIILSVNSLFQKGTMSSATGIIRCPPYCRTNCATTHHPLLVALLNTVDTADVELMEKRLQEFREIFMRYTVLLERDCSALIAGCQPKTFNLMVKPLFLSEKPLKTFILDDKPLFQEKLFFR